MSSTRKQRILGALLGVHAGDSLGATVEFSSWAEIRQIYPDGLRDIIGGGPFGWQAGHATDDTDLTRAVLLAYAESETAETTETTKTTDPVAASISLATSAAEHMLDWYDGRWPGRKPGSRPVDAGRATRTGLERFRGTRDVLKAGAGQNEAGNGSLMRCIATGVLVTGGEGGEREEREKRRLRESALISAVTHDDWRCVLACAAYNTMAAALVDGASPDEAVSAGEGLLREHAATNSAIATIVEALGRGGQAGQAGQAGQGLDSDELQTIEEHRRSTLAAISYGRLVQVASVAAHGPQSAVIPGALTSPAADVRLVLPGKASGYVLESLTLAVSAVLASTSVEDTLVYIVRIGRDTDTNAAVAGGLLGARDGVEAIPLAWRSKLQFADEFTAVLDKLNV